MVFVGFSMSVGGEHVCVLFGRIFDYAPVGICYTRVRDGGTCSPDTVTCPKKNAAHDRGISHGNY